MALSYSLNFVIVIVRREPPCDMPHYYVLSYRLHFQSSILPAHLLIGGWQFASTASPVRGLPEGSSFLAPASLGPEVAVVQSEFLRIVRWRAILGALTRSWPLLLW